MKRLAILLLILGLLSGGLILAGCCSTTGKVSESGNQGNVAPPSNPSVAQNTNIENAEIGKTYTINYLNSQYEVTLSKVEFADSLYPFTGHYLMGFFEIKNIGDKSEFLAPDIYALDSSSEKYDNTIALGVDDKYSKTLDFIKTLPPGTKMSGWIAIEVPKETNNFDLRFEYSNPYLSQTPNYIKWRVTQD